MKTNVYLADLTHTESGIMALTFPLGTAFVASYARKILGDHFDFRLFKFPEGLSEAIVEKPPRILALSNYIWNFELGYKLAAWAKRRDPGLVVIFGGPNFPVDMQEKKRFLQQRPVIDFYIEHEGEVGFATIVEKLEAVGFDVAAFKKTREVITNCVYMVDDDLVEGGIERIADVNEIPSPYLSGLLDEFFDYPLTPMLETARGCPFSCAFCADGLPTKSKITHFEKDRVRDELVYMAERTKRSDELNVTDLNFGMYKRDVGTAELIAEMQMKYQWPKLVKGSAGKNKPERVIETASLLKGSWVIGSAIQSSDQEVLKNIKRANISVDAYQDFLGLMNRLDKKASTYSEIILGLPGDSKEKHYTSLRYAIDSGVDQVKSYQAMLLAGTDMASQATRKNFGLVTKHRIMAGGIGTYDFGGDKIRVGEIQEIIVGSKDLTWDDYVACRTMSLILETYYNKAPFGEIFSALRVMGLEVFDFLIYLQDHLSELATPRMKEILDEFVDGTTTNLYDTHQEAEEQALSDELYPKYISGELGYNEILECKAMLYFEMEDTLSVLLKALSLYLTDKGLMTAGVQEYFDQLGEFILCMKREINKTDLVLERRFNYDFGSIDNLNYEVDPRNVERAELDFQFKFFHDDQQKTEINQAVKQYENHPGGISRVLYVQNMRKMYRVFERVS